MRFSSQLAVTAVGAAVVAACSAPTQSEPVAACVGTAWPAVVAEVRTDAGAPAAMGAMLVVQDGAYVDSAGPAAAWDSLRLGAAENRAGTYTVRVSKPYYRTVVVRGIGVPGGPCGAIRATIVPVTLTLLPDAPPVRSVVAYPTTGLGLAGITVPFHAYVDAAPGVATAVTWSSTDTSVVTISPAGLATSRCRTRLGEAAVVARSTADPSKAGRAAVTVLKNADRCP